MNGLSNKKPTEDMQKVNDSDGHRNITETSARGYKRCEEAKGYIEKSDDPKWAAEILDMVG